jgi:hypothetical protein
MIRGAWSHAWQSVPMTDRLPRPDARDTRRWPSDPAHLVDSTRCPACFSQLYSTQCFECGLDLAVPASAELLQLSTRVHAGELERQAFIGRMREEQASREAPAPSRLPAFTDPVAVPAFVGASAAAQPTAVPSGTPEAHPVVAPAAPVASVEAATMTVDVPTDSTPPLAAPDAPRKSGRSGVQVFLLALGVVLISVTAIVFLFVAYLVASLEVRSVIIAVASVLVLGLAWLLRARRLPGTAEGVASVAVVLLLLDVWTVRNYGLFGTEALNGAAYTGMAFAVVAGLLAATRALSGIRVPGFAAAGLTPIAAFLLGGATIDTGPATDAWLGGLAAVLVGAVATAIAIRSPERVILLSAGVAGGVVALASALWALPDVARGELWSFLAVAAGWLLLGAATHFSRQPVGIAWGRAAAVGAGAAAALAPVVVLAAELEPGLAIWIAPASAGVIAAGAAAISRLGGRIGGEAKAALIAAGAVAAAATIPGDVMGLIAVDERLRASVPAWQVGLDDRVLGSTPDLDLAIVLVPFVIAAGSTVVLILLGALRRFAAIPIGVAGIGVLVSGSILPGAAVPTAIFVALGVGALAVAASRMLARTPALLPTLAIVGTGGAGLAVWTGYSNTGAWPWAIAAVLGAAIAGRVLARRIWPATAVMGVGATHLVLAALLAGAALYTVPLWLDASGGRLAAPWDSPWMWLGTVGVALLAVVLLLPGLPAADRIGLTVPMLATVTLGALATAFGGGQATLQWLPVTLAAIVIVGALRAPLPALVRVVLAAMGPILLAVALDRILAAIPTAPPAILGSAAAVLASAALASLVVPSTSRAARIAWSASLGAAGLVTLAGISSADDQRWLLLLLLTPVPMLVASLDGDPIGGSAPTRHLSWLSLPLAVAAVWTWLADEGGVDDVEAYTLPLAAALAIAGGLVTWRRLAAAGNAAGRTALFAVAAAIAVVPSVAASGQSELRALILVAAGVVVALAGTFLRESARGVPIRLLAVVTGWVAFTGTAVVRGSAVAQGAPSDLPVEFWPILAFGAGAALAIAWARTASRPAQLAEGMLAASVAIASVPTLLAITFDDAPIARTAVLLPVLALLHIASAAATYRPVAGPVLGWTSLATLVIAGGTVLASGNVEPFDLVTAPIAVALLGAGALRMHRAPSLGSWPALGMGLAVLLLPSLVADFTDPQLWRTVALGLVSAALVLVGAIRRLQAPLLFGGAVLLIHALAQLWPWISLLYEAVWWWLWLGIAGVVLVALAATYERQIRMARGVVRSIGSLR